MLEGEHGLLAYLEGIMETKGGFAAIVMLGLLPLAAVWARWEGVVGPGCDSVVCGGNVVDGIIHANGSC